MASPPRAEPRPATPARHRSSRLPLAVGLDVFSVVLFVAVGRRNHDEDPALAGVFSTAAPFLLALAVGWLVARAWRAPITVTTGLVVWPVTVAIGMLLRRWVFDDGTAASFVVVAALFLGLLLVGWRALLTVATRRGKLRP